MSRRWAYSTLTSFAQLPVALEAGAEPRMIVCVPEDREQLRIVEQISRDRPDIPMIVVWFGSPHELRNLPSSLPVICTYSSHRASRQAAMRVLLGESVAPVRLPVTLDQCSDC